jgi:hypothetical protein
MMTDIQSVSEPVPLASGTAVGLVLLAERLALMGADLGEAADARAVLDAVEALGVGVVTVTRLRTSADPAVWERGVERLLDLVEQSPTPEGEWDRVGAVLGEELLADLTGVSKASLARYRGGQRRTPDAVAARLHHVAMTTADLAGSYTPAGIRRWFDRPRTALDGRTPRAVLEGSWAPEDEGPTAMRELARSLVMM